MPRKTTNPDGDNSTPADPGPARAPAPEVAYVTGAPTKLQTTDEDVRRAVMGDRSTLPLEAATERGMIGNPTDPTPNENYTLAGVVAGAPTPETDPQAWADANAPARFPGALQAIPGSPSATGEAAPVVAPAPAGRLYSADNPQRAADVAAGRPPFGPTGGPTTPLEGQKDGEE